MYLKNYHFKVLKKARWGTPGDTRGHYADKQSSTLDSRSLDRVNSGRIHNNAGNQSTNSSLNQRSAPGPFAEI